MPDWLQDALVGVAGGAIFALTKLRSDLCEGDELPSLRRRHAAWLQFAIYMWAAPVFSGALTPSLMKKVGTGPSAWVTAPMIAVVIGVNANFLWPILQKSMSDEVVGRVKSAFGAIFGGQK